jgi:hypothetical protein
MNIMNMRGSIPGSDYFSPFGGSDELMSGYVGSSGLVTPDVPYSGGQTDNGNFFKSLPRAVDMKIIGNLLIISIVFLILSTPVSGAFQRIDPAGDL